MLMSPLRPGEPRQASQPSPFWVGIETESMAAMADDKVACHQTSRYAVLRIRFPERKNGNLSKGRQSRRAGLTCTEVKWHLADENEQSCPNASDPASRRKRPLRGWDSGSLTIREGEPGEEGQR
jgi:hypothetical protein